MVAAAASVSRALCTCVCDTVCCGRLLWFTLTCGQQPHTAPASRCFACGGWRVICMQAQQCQRLVSQLALLFQWLPRMPPSYTPLPVEPLSIPQPCQCFCMEHVLAWLPRSALGLQHRTHTPQHCPALTRLVFRPLPLRAVRDFTPPAQCPVWHADFRS